MKKVPVSFLVMTVFGGLNSCGESESKSKNFEICVAGEEKKNEFPACTEEFVNAKINDGASCSYENCKVNTEVYDSGCHPYFVKSKASKPSDREQCVYSRPVEL